MAKYNLRSSSLLVAGTLGATVIGVSLVGSGVGTVHAATLTNSAPTTTHQNNQTVLEQGRAKIDADHQAADAQAQTQYQQALQQAKTNQSSADLRAQRAYDTTANQARGQYQQDLTVAQQSVQSAANTQQQATYDQAKHQIATDYQKQTNTIQQQYQAGVDQANQAKQAVINQAQTVRDQATQNATVALIHPATGLNATSNLSDLGQQVASTNGQLVDPMTELGLYESIPASWIQDGQAKVAATVSQEGQLPTQFLPGVLLYDGAHDHSEVIATTGLTDAQKQRLNDLSNQWMNTLRDYYYRTLHGNLMNTNVTRANNPDGSIKYATLKTEADFWTVVQDLGTLREQHNWSYNHTLSKFGGYNYYDVVGKQLPQLGSTWSAENLYTLTGHTMLEFEVTLYNRMQAMLYGELSKDSAGSYQDLVGHLRNALNPVFSEAAMGFQKLGDVKGMGPRYNVVWEFLGTNAYDQFNNQLNQALTDHRTITTPVASHQATGGFVQTDVVKAISDAQTTPQANQAVSTRAQATYEDAVAKATNDYQQALTKLAQVRDQALAKAQQAYQQKLQTLAAQFAGPVTATVDPSVISQLQAKRDNAIKAAQTQLEQAKAQAEREYQTQADTAKAKYDQVLAANKTKAEAAEAQLEQALARQEQKPVVTNHADGLTTITMGGGVTNPHQPVPVAAGQDPTATPKAPTKEVTPTAPEKQVVPAPKAPTKEATPTEPVKKAVPVPIKEVTPTAPEKQAVPAPKAPTKGATLTEPVKKAVPAPTMPANEGVTAEPVKKPTTAPTTPTKEATPAATAKATSQSTVMITLPAMHPASTTTPRQTKQATLPQTGNGPADAIASFGLIGLLASVVAGFWHRKRNA